MEPQAAPVDVLGAMERMTVWVNEVGVACCPGDAPATTVAPPNEEWKYESMKTWKQEV